ncbi:hypothetical protein [Aquitalea sp. LB_tupeE]|uniref:hypothetical protein n=1 Tax=Aquitalea sp. LB_tupeE TaxID=2748078 RepID=UPI0015BAE809|nr:hypothetical protein [Aquitalea sp. LB_tupeE]NWK80014.1 hypothetical protein [Aquitalea sp. LB_tupeE]
MRIESNNSQRKIKLLRCGIVGAAGEAGMTSVGMWQGGAGVSLCKPPVCQVAVKILLMGLFMLLRHD